MSPSSPTGPLKTTHICIIYPITFSSSSWRPDKIATWITAHGGKVLTKFSPEATHLVCAEKAWKGPHKEVQKAQDAVEVQNHGVKIVTPQWLEDALGDTAKGVRKPKAESYLWERVERMEKAIEKRVVKAVERDGRGAAGAGGGGGHVGLMTEVLEQSTAPYVSEEQRRQVEREIERQKAKAIEAKKREEVERVKAREEERRKRREVARGKGKKPKNDFSEAWHIWKDSTGFEYDIKLTKVDTRHNRNERYELTFQIYESNALHQTPELAHRGPHHTYATNLHFAATGQLASNSVIAALGCNLPTAYRLFCKAFREQTGIEWADRVAFAVERVKREKRVRGDGTGSPVGDDELQRALEASESAEFSEKPFVYLPPMYGPRGKMPVAGEDIYESLIREQKRRDLAAAAAAAAAERQDDGGDDAAAAAIVLDEEDGGQTSADMVGRGEGHVREALVAAHEAAEKAREQEQELSTEDASAKVGQVVEQEQPPSSDSPPDFEQYLAESGGDATQADGNVREPEPEQAVVNEPLPSDFDNLFNDGVDATTGQDQNLNSAAENDANFFDFEGPAESAAKMQDSLMQAFTQDTEFDATQAAMAVRDELEAEMAGPVGGGGGGNDKKRKTPPVEYELGGGGDGGPCDGKSPRFRGEGQEMDGDMRQLFGEDAGVNEMGGADGQFMRELQEAAGDDGVER